MEETDRALLQGRASKVVFLPTAAGLEGDARVQHWLDLGRRHYERIGAEPLGLKVTERAHAQDAGVAAEVAGAGLIYLSGGNPGYLAATLRGTVLWEAILAAHAAGAALAGCSAGAMALSAVAPNSRNWEGEFPGGLGVIPHVALIPHFDKIGGWVPNIVDRYLTSTPDDITLIGIDEDTSIVGGPEHWVVMGRQSVWMFAADGSARRFGAGDEVALPVSPR